MTGRERLLTAIRCEEPDRVPLNMMGVDVWDEAWVAARDESYRPVIELTAEHGDFYPYWYPACTPLYTDGEELHQTRDRVEDSEWVETRDTWETPAGPLHMTYRYNQRENTGMRAEHAVKTLEDLDRALSVPYVPDRPDCTRFFEIDRLVGDRGQPFVDLLDPFFLVHCLVGSETMALWSVLHRERVLEAVEILTQRAEDLVRYLIAQGVGPVFGWIGTELCVPPLMSPADFREFIVPFDARLHRLVHEAGGLVHHHCHSKVGTVLEDFAAMGVDSLDPLEAPPMGDVTLTEAKRRIGDRVCLHGNVQFGDMIRAPEQDIARQVRECLRVGAPGGGYVLTQTSIPHMRVLEPQTVRNYVTFIETAVQCQRAG
jgi:hypothetical protein